MADLAAVATEPPGVVVPGIVASIGRVDVPSKWPQKPLASTASWKRTEKITQLTPLASSLGIEEGRESEREVVATDIRAGPITCRNTRTKAQLFGRQTTEAYINYLERKLYTK